MTPAEELRAAAAKLREAAGGATPGVWAKCWDALVGGAAVSLPRYIQEDGGAEVCIADFVKPGDAEWIALMGPDKAEMIAVWLDDEARDATQLEGFVTFSDNWPALLFARAVLGEKP